MGKLDFLICRLTGKHGPSCRGRYCPTIPDLEATAKYDWKSWKEHRWIWWKVWWRDRG